VRFGRLAVSVVVGVLGAVAVAAAAPPAYEQSQQRILDYVADGRRIARGTPVQEQFIRTS
jgi:uncharacterized protein involved in exopolysaccharide biosynthesis